MADTQFQLTQNFDYNFLRNKLEHHSWTVVDTTAATAANYGTFFIVPAAGVLEEAWETHKTAGTNGGAVTLQIEKLTSGQALDAGTEILATAFNLKSTANVPVRQIPTATIGARQLARGDRLALKDAGTLTDVAHVTVTVAIRYKL